MPKNDAADARKLAPHSRRRRVHRALAARDWVGIAIELLVVTLGVLLAFQVQLWGNERNRSDEEHRLLDRLYDETGRGATELKDVVSTHQRAVDQLGAVLRAKNDSPRLVQYTHIEGFGCVIGTLPTAAYNDTASQELVASGRINMISDPSLRDAVRALAAEQAMGTQHLDYGRQNIMILLPIFLKYYRNELPAGSEDTKCRIEWAALAHDNEAVSALARAYRVHQLMLQIRKSTLAVTNDLHRKLGCRLYHHC